MNNQNGALHFEATLTKEQFEKAIKNLENQIRGISVTAEAETEKVNKSFSKLGTLIGGYFSARALMGFTQAVINIRGEFQKTEIAFSTMLGSQQKAKDLMKDMIELAATTPFSLQEVTEGAKQLLAFQVPAEEVTDTLKRMGDIAAGLSIPLGRIQLVFGQVRAKGKLMGDDLRQFTEAGVPMLAELGRQLGKTQAEISDMVSGGQISFDHVKKVLFDMTDAGGMFFNLMEKQSASLTGKISNLQDEFEQILNKIGESDEGFLNSSIEGVTFLVEHYKELAEIIGSLVAAYGTYKAALIAINTAQKVHGILLYAQNTLGKQLTVTQRLLALSYAATDKAQRALNASMLANPAVWVVAALGALVYTIYKLSTAETDAERATRLYNEALEERKKIIDETKAKAEELNRVLADENSTDFQKANAFEELKALLPGLVGDMSQLEYTTKLTAQGQKLLNEEMDRMSTKKLQDDIKQAEKQIASYKQSIEDLSSPQMGGMKENAGAISVLKNRSRSESELLAQLKEKQKVEAETMRISKLSNDERMAELEAEKRKYQEVVDKGVEKAKEFSDIQDQIADGLQRMFDQSMYDNALKQIGRINNELGKLNPNSAENVKNRGFWDKQAKDAQDAANDIPTNEMNKRADEYREAQKLYREAERELEKYNLGEKKTTAKQKAEEIFPAGSVAEIERRIQKIDEALKKTPATSPKIEGLKQQRIKLAKELAEAQKLVEIKTLEQTIDEMFSKWQLYYKSVELYGKENTGMNPFFAGMNDTSLLDFIQGQIDILKQLKEPTNEQIELLIKLKQQMNEIQGIDAFTSFRESLEDLKDASDDPFEYIEKLNQVLTGLDPDSSPDYFKKRAELESQLKEQRKIIADGYKQMLEDQKSFADKRADVEDQYEKRLKDIYLKSATDVTFDRAGHMEALNKWKAQQLDEITKTELEASAAWQIVFNNLGQYSQKAVNLAVIELKRLAQDAHEKGNLTREELDKILEKLNATEKGFHSAFEKMLDQMKKAFENGFDGEIFGGALQEASAMFQQMGEDVIGMYEDITGESAEMARQIIGDIANIANGMGELAQGIQTGNPVSIVSGLSKVVHTLSNWISGDRKRDRAIKRHKEAIEELRNAYERLQFAIENALGEEKYQKQGALIQNLIQQQEQLKKIRQEEINKKKTDKSAVLDYSNQIASIDEQIERIKQSITEDITQTSAKSLSEELATALENAYARGEDAAIAWGKVADDVMNQAIRNALRVKFLEEPLKKAVEDLRRSMGFDESGAGSFDGLTEEERQKFKDQIKAASEAYQAAMEALGGDFGFGAQQTLQGAIKGITEDTAGLIEGQMNAIRINQAEMLEIQQHQYELTQSIVSQLNDISYNTSRLHGIANDLTDLRNHIILNP